MHILAYDGPVCPNFASSARPELTDPLVGFPHSDPTDSPNIVQPPASEAEPWSPSFTFPEGAPAAILWDMDGTLIDTEPYWMGSEAELVQSFGGRWTDDDGLAMVGKPLVDGALIMQDRGVDMTIPEIVEWIVERVGSHLAREVPWQPGAYETLQVLRDLGIPMALVTASYDSLAATFIDTAPAGTFDAVVTGEQVANGKPHPEPYLMAAERLGVEITDCIAFEDSLPGVASALASGATTIGVRSAVPIAPRPGLSRIRNLTQLSDDVFTAVRSGQTVDFLGEEH